MFELGIYQPLNADKHGALSLSLLQSYQSHNRFSLHLLFAVQHHGISHQSFYYLSATYLLLVKFGNLGFESGDDGFLDMVGKAQRHNTVMW